MSELEKEDRELDDIFDSVDDLATKGRFDLIDERLRATNVQEQSTTINIGLLAITFTMSDDLKERNTFKIRVEEKLISTVGIDKTRSLLNGL